MKKANDSKKAAQEVTAQKLLRSQAQFRSFLEQPDIQAAELKAPNEKLHAINEDLRAATEEPETGREQLRSVNEELVTVNQELKIKIEQLSQSNNDLKNLISSTRIAAIFLDRDCRIKSFTPAAGEIFNLIPSDSGRLLSDITHKLAYENLLNDVAAVLDDLQPVEREVKTIDEIIYLIQVLPYRTTENHISGTIITFVDISKSKKQENELRQSYAHLKIANDAMLAGWIFWNFKTGEIRWDERVKQVFGFEDEEESLTVRSWQSRIHPADLPKVEASIAECLANDEDCNLYFRVIRAAGDTRIIHASGRFQKAADNTPLSGTAIVMDVTEQKQAEENLHRSEKRLRKAMDAGQVIWWEMNLKTQDFTCSENTEDVLGFALPSQISKNLADFINSENAPQAAETGGFYDDTIQFVNPKTGETVWLHTQGSLVSDDNGQKRFTGVTQNITERVNAKQAAKQSEENLQIFFQAVEMGTWSWNLITDQIIWNDQHYRLFGLPPSDNPITPEDIFAVVHPDYRQQLREKLIRTINEKVLFDDEFCVVLADGSTRWISGYGKVVEESNNRATKVNGVVVDITESRLAKLALRESDSRLRLIISSIKDYAIISMDTAGIINDWNTGAEKIFGYTKEEIIGQHSEIIFTPEDREKGVPQKEMETAAAKGKAEDERWHIRRDGSRFYVSGIMQPLKGNKLEGFVKIARDMTERIKAEQTEHDKEMLQKLVRAQEDERKRIARDLHDELGQKLTALRLKLESIKRNTESKEEFSDNIDEAQVLAKNIDDGVDFLAWELRPAALDDLGLAAALEKYIREWSRYSGIPSEFRIFGLKEKRILSEIETNLYRITQEALNNIYKHSNASRAEVSLEKRDNSVILIIEDDGKGFSVKSKKSRRNGIGLIGMQERATLVGGTLEIESSRGNGTIVFVRIPNVFNREKSNE